MAHKKTLKYLKTELLKATQENKWEMVQDLVKEIRELREKVVTIKMDIIQCSQCPFVTNDNKLTSGAFISDKSNPAWYCTANKNKIIKNPYSTIPTECPFREGN